MNFNLWHGGDGSNLPRDTSIKYEIATIKASKASVVGIEEHISGLSDRSSRAMILAKQLGWNCVIISSNRAVISPYELTPVKPSKPQPANHHGSAKDQAQLVMVHIPNQKPIAFGVMHLMYAPYESYDIADGKLTKAEQVESSAAKARLAEVKSIADEAQLLMAKGIPVVLVGDFNEPSCLDWTASALKGRNDPRFTFPVKWPCSAYLLKSGFIDAYRSAHPSTFQYPGYTWTTKPGLWHTPEVHDRIDLIHVSKSTIKVKSSWTVGDQSELSDQVVLPWTSDHRAVCAEIAIK